jgi:hypothetical protein
VLFGSDVEFASTDLHGEAGNDDLHAGAAGSSLDGGTGADRLFSGAGDDQLSGGLDENFLPDQSQDLYVYGSGPWSTPDSFFGDVLFGFEDGIDLFDLRGSGLTFADLTIVNEEFQTTITSSLGKITIFESFDQPVEITAADFLF